MRYLRRQKRKENSTGISVKSSSRPTSSDGFAASGSPISLKFYGYSCALFHSTFRGDRGKFVLGCFFLKYLIVGVEDKVCIATNSLLVFYSFCIKVCFAVSRVLGQTNSHSHTHFLLLHTYFSFKKQHTPPCCFLKVKYVRE